LLSREQIAALDADHQRSKKDRASRKRAAREDDSGVGWDFGGGGDGGGGD
jgi:hypothetical protein